MTFPYGDRTERDGTWAVNAAATLAAAEYTRGLSGDCSLESLFERWIKYFYAREWED